MVTLTILNGQLPASMLTELGGGEALRHDAAASYRRARAAGMPAGITSSYRTRAQQQPLYARYVNDLRTGRKPARLAAKPGQSPHGEGLALDLRPAPELWLRAHPEYGWRFTIKSEKWHAEYDPARDRTQSTPAPDESHGPVVTEEDDVLIIKHARFGAYLLHGSKLTGLSAQSSVDAIAASGVAAAWLDHDEDFLRIARSSTSTFVLFNPANQGNGGYAVWAGGQAVGIGDQKTVDQLLAQGAALLTVSRGDFDRFLAA
jgi:hypothetical protein